MGHWIEMMVMGSGEGLGKVSYRHVHDDGTIHQTKLDVLNPSGVWGGEIGVYNPEVKVQCLDCKAILQENDCIQLDIKQGEKHDG